MIRLKRLAGGGFALLGAALALLLVWDWLVPAADGTRIGFIESLPMLSLSLMWLAVGLWLLGPIRRQRRADAPRDGERT